MSINKISFDFLGISGVSLVSLVSLFTGAVLPAGFVFLMFCEGLKEPPKPSYQP